MVLGTPSFPSAHKFFHFSWIYFASFD
uniref:Uncharacterized protein n=1 Tax=Arundo donax TaxID=35708 RepID=A0A0A8YH78_ARUDO